ncbi:MULTISPECIES: siderophore-interacting protein [Rhodococcus]|uniref:Siderophore-interacting protein n=1 Tax=Rhodococcus oxybenzonivorans TaxID=1990687 RepID=A0AAE4UWN8_9NOCA|nr:MULTISPECIES: siderophore-interacting protein [Rhodococcus]MDV7244715.1 siderophore-interacting protein [Rhodococcus oxybenzonivorans]MDV7264085.1 siderophore-interacting protein [Rhodococcus oxybenzonivorans]MDV7275786.1 siderophore-interacting protein [Rhodococcus oxybenzonivorans]MDV7332563.1 siderophore-interacting protein [Rhodococcus oxybenzonivorans]MDV7346359.1 siderophore-interacting protein [Rhodococcus oxybenzonivorans]
MPVHSSEQPDRWAPVVRTERVTPNMQRITLSGGDLTEFESSGVPDERVLLAFPPGGAEQRSFTVRRWDPSSCEMDIDFAVHAGGAAIRWALQASPGDVLGFSAAAGWYSPPSDTAWQLLVADMTGLPAVGRIVEELPGSAHVHVIAEITSAEDRQQFTTEADVTVTWLHGSGNGTGRSRLAEAARTWPRPSEPGYVWFAGEARTSRDVRRRLRHELVWPANRYDVMGYWRENKEDWVARYETVREQIEAARDSALAAGEDFDAVRDAVDAALERSGL